MLCGYGCKQEAVYQFKNGKFCCNQDFRKCPELGRRHSEYMKTNNPSTNPEVSARISKSMIGKNMGPKTDIHKENLSNSMVKKWKDPDSKWNLQEYREFRRQFMLNGGAFHVLSFPIKGYKNRSEWMRNGQAAYICSCNTNPSKGQVETWITTCRVCPYVYLNYSITHLQNMYCIDIAIPKLGIAIEYDGSYWHQDREKDLKREQELIEDGWKFLRYVDQVPTLEQLREDILRLID